VASASWAVGREREREAQAVSVQTGRPVLGKAASW